MTLAKRVTEAIQNSGKSPADIARKISRSSSALTQLMNGTTKSLKADTAIGLQTETGYRAEWLITGKGPRMNLSNTESGPVVRRGVPLISWIRAGQWDEARDPLQPGDAEAWIPSLRPTSNGAYALRVRGDSMTTTHGKSYPEGCIIIVEPERRLPANGERVVAKLDGTNEVTFKVYKEEDGRRWLQPLNRDHEPIREPFKVLGTVIGKWEDD